VTALLAGLIGCGGTSGPGPETTPHTGAASALWIASPLPARERLLAILNAETAVDLRAVGRLTVGTSDLAVELLLNRSGAMRLTTGDGGLLMVSSGARLRTFRGERSEEAPAWRSPVASSDRPDLAISPFDLVAALLPAPWPDPGAGDGRVALSRVPEGTWVTLLDDAESPEPLVRRRALVAAGGERVTVRESYDAGQLERVVEWPEPGRVVVIRRPQAGTVVRLTLESVERDPALTRHAYRFER
jgi:hypothetical protein